MAIDNNPHNDDRSVPPASSPWTKRAGLSTGPVSLEPYRSDQLFNLEKERIFKRAWLLIGRQEQLANAGDFVVKQLEIANSSILITRDSKHVVRAFHNVCSHRSNQLVWSRKGSASMIKCPYHSWVYRLDGSLAGVPGEASFFGLDKKACGLTPVSIEIWEGWLFINLDPTPEVSLVEFLGSIGTHLSGIRYNSASSPVVIRADINANWKIVSDAFAESYHIATLHPQTIGGIFASNANPSGTLIDAQFFEAHRSGSMYGNPDYVVPERQRLDRILFNMSDGLAADVDGAAVEEFLSHPAVNPSRRSDWSLDVNHIFPNSHIDTNRGGFLTHQFWPVARTRTRYEAHFYMAKPESMLTQIKQDHFIARVMETVLEDLSNVERLQQSIDSRAKDFMHLQDNEVLIRHSLDVVDKWIHSKTVKEAMARSDG